MRRRLALLAGICAAGTAAAQLPKMDDLLKGVDKLPKTPVSPLPPGTTDDKTGAAGIKEALAVGTERAVQNLSAKDGYFGRFGGARPEAIFPIHRIVVRPSERV